MHRFTLTTITFALLFFATTAADAAVTLSPSDRGWYRESGSPGTISPSANYLAGELGGGRYRNFFTFDLAGVTDFITSARLEIDFVSVATPDPSETYTLFATTLPSADFDGGTAGLPGYDDLGSGEVLAALEFTPADANTVVSIPLSVSAVQMLNDAGGKLTIGGAITTLGGGSDEHAFRFSTGKQSDLVLETLPSATTTYTAYSRGAYRSDTGAFGTAGAGTSTGNYFTGRDSGREYRSFFAFDLGAVSGLVVGARMRVDAATYFSSDPAELIELKDVTGDVEALTTDAGGFAAFDDLADGYTYGHTRVTAADNGSILDIPLGCHALADLNANRGNFAIGGRVVGADNQNGAVWGTSTGAALTELELTTLPSSQQVLTPTRGWYKDDGSVSTLISPTANYVAGEFFSSFPGIYRNFFTFDLSGVGDLIVGAYLEIDTAFVVTPDASETWTLFETTLPSASFDSGTAGIPGWQDLGDGKVLGRIEVDASASDTVVRVPLTAVAISNLNAATGDVTFGGSVTTIGGGSDEYVMGGSGTGDVSNLVLITLPADLANSIGPERRGSYSDVSYTYDSAGAGTPTGNYVSGKNSIKEWRHVLGYDLAGLEGCAITAQLALDTAVAATTDPSEQYTLFETTSDYDLLTTGFGGLAAWLDLGSGEVFGELEFDGSDDGETVDVPLSPEGVKTLNARSGGAGKIAFGGTITTLSTPGTETLFAAGFVSDQTELVVTEVPLPEPDGWLLRASGVLLLAVLARGRRWRAAHGGSG